MSGAKAQMEDGTARLARVREELAAVTAEAKRLEALPVPLVDAQRRIEEYVARSADAYLDEARVFSRPDAPRIALGELLPHASDGQLEALLCALLPEPVTALLTARLRKLMEGSEMIAADERAARLRELSTRRRALEIEEERIIRAAEAEGVELDRRGAAPPDLVLAEILPA